MKTFEFAKVSDREEAFGALIALVPSLDSRGRELAVRLLQLSRDVLLISDLIETLAVAGDSTNREIIALLGSPPNSIEANKWIDAAIPHSLPEIRNAARWIAANLERPYSVAA